VHQRDESTVSQLCGHEGQLLPPRRRPAGEGGGMGCTGNYAKAFLCLN
jgi:hypothetical protein